VLRALIHEFHTSANRIIFEAEMVQLALSIYPNLGFICIENKESINGTRHDIKTQKTPKMG